MLQRLSLRSFKAYGEVEGVAIAPFTVLIGKNGAGKTTVLQALDLMGGLVRGTLKEHLTSEGWDYRDLPHLLADRLRFGMCADLALGKGRLLRWDVEFETRRRPGLSKETVEDLRAPDADGIVMARVGRQMKRVRADGSVEEIRQTLTSSWLATVDPKADLQTYPDLVDVATWARGIRSYLLDPTALRRPSRPGDDIGRHGELLAGTLGRLQQRDPKAFKRVVDRVRHRYPTLRSLTVKRGKYGWTNILAEEHWGSSSATFNARQVSDGLLRLLAVAVLPELADRPSLILLDEVENGLHPHLLGAFIEMLQDAVEDAKGKLQVIVTSHSPIALNFVRSADRVLLVHRGADGSAQLTPMQDLRDFARLRAHFDLGELWYNVGEEKLLRQRTG